MKFSVSFIIMVFLSVAVTATHAAEAQKDYPITPVPFTYVQIDDVFWLPRMETNRNVSIPHIFNMCEGTGRVDNFPKAAGMMSGNHKELWFSDSDIYKAIEGASYCLSLKRDPEYDLLEKYIDNLISLIAAAQENDGYLFTARTIDPKNPVQYIGDTRWSFVCLSHELYCAGTLYEAAVAYYQATGKRAFLDVAIKNADLIDRVFGPDKKRDVPGHQEIEIGLVKLYRLTGKEKYLKLAKFFLDERGHAHGRELYSYVGNIGWMQDHKPVVEQDEAVGHAVRAGYMYIGMADVAALTGDSEYVKAIDRIWDNIVSKKISLTGGIGACNDEGFGENYDLRNDTAYNETCAAIANAMWNHRLFLLHGDAKYIDVLETVIYNGFLSGVSISGDKFFYTNPLSSDGVYKNSSRVRAATRKPWFNCPCCPPSVTRFMPSLSGYAYARCDDTIYINLFIGGSGTVKMPGNSVNIKQDTRYPWDGAVTITVEPESPAEFAINVRIPCWARNQPMPGDLYRYMKESNKKATLKVNGRKFAYDVDKGFARILRTWEKGDVIELDITMPVRRVLCHENVKENAGRVALMRGPIVYCAEGVDNGGHTLNLLLIDDRELHARHRGDLLNGVTVLTGKIAGLYYGDDGKSVVNKEQDFVAIPYYAWSNRGVGEMEVWVARDISAAKPVKAANVH